MNDNSQTIKELSKLMVLLKSEDYFVKSNDFVSAYKQVADVIKTLRTENQSVSNDTVTKVQGLLDSVFADHEQLEEGIHSKMTANSADQEKMKQNFDTTMQSIKDEWEKVKADIVILNGKDGINGIDGKDGVDGKDGQNVDENTLLLKMNDLIPDEESGESIIEKINELPDEEEFKIDWLHIKNTPDFKNKAGFLPVAASRYLEQLVDVNLTNLSKDANGNYILGSSSATSGVTLLITQASHGFTVGAILKLSGSSYALAEGDTSSDAEVTGMVSQVVDTNNFSLTIGKGSYVTGLSALIDDVGNPLVAGTFYFLSPTSAGLLTPTAPISNGNVRKPVFQADSTSSGFFHNYIGDVLSTAGVTITLTGAVTGAGITSIVTALGTNVVNYSNFQQVAASSLVGNPTGSLANASGITLGVGLAFSGTTLKNSAVITSPNSTITVGGTAPSATIDLNLASSNIWTAKQTIQLATNQLQLGFDGSNFLTATVSSVGSTTFALTGTSPTFSFSNGVNVSAGSLTITTSSTGAFLATNSVNTNSNFAAVANNGGMAASSSVAGIQFGGSTNVQYRILERGSTSTVLTASVNAANHIFGQSPMTSATSGTHALIANVAITVLPITGGIGNITNAVSLFLDGAPTVTGGSGTVGNLFTIFSNSGMNGFVGKTSHGLALTVAPTALVHIGAGTSTANTAPLKFTSGTNLTTTEAGAIEYNGAHLYFTATNSGTRYQLDQQGVSNYTHTIFTPTTGQTVSLVNNQYNIVNPSGALLALTLSLPSSPANNDVVYIKFTQNITTVTYTNGTVVDGITAPTAGGLTVLTYDSATTSWY